MFIAKVARSKIPILEIPMMSESRIMIGSSVHINSEILRCLDNLGKVLGIKLKCPNKEIKMWRMIVHKMQQEIV